MFYCSLVNKVLENFKPKLIKEKDENNEIIPSPFQFYGHIKTFMSHLMVLVEPYPTPNFVTL